MVHTSSSSQNMWGKRSDKNRSWISIFSNPIRRKLCRMWKEASVETEHLQLLRMAHLSGSGTWNFQASAQDSLLKKKAWQDLRQSLSQATIALIRYVPIYMTYIEYYIWYLRTDGINAKRRKEIGHSETIGNKHSNDSNGVGISGAGLRLVDSGAPNDCFL